MSLGRLVVFLSVVSGLTALIHYFLWARLVRDPAWPAPWSKVGGWLFLVLAIMLPVGLILARTLAPHSARPLAWPVFLWMGGMFLLLAILVPLDLVLATVALARRASNEALVDPSRRHFLARLVAGTAGFAALGLAVGGVASALGPIAVKRVRVPIRDLPPALEGFRIVQLTDVHVGPTIGRAFLAALVARVNALAPDLVAVTGDLVDGAVAHLGEQVTPLAELKARHGTFFVTGNHEYYAEAEPWIAFLRGLQVRVLRNERVTLDHGGAHLDVAGIDDFHGGDFYPDHGADVAKAMAGRDPDRPVVLLAHQPKAIFEAAEHGVSLQLSGHTHGGQIFPFNFVVGLVQPYVSGLHRHGETMIYVSRGTGFWGPPMRVGQPAEIALLELTAAPA